MAVVLTMIRLLLKFDLIPQYLLRRLGPAVKSNMFLFQGVKRANFFYNRSRNFCQHCHKHVSTVLMTTGQWCHIFTPQFGRHIVSRGKVSAIIPS